LKFQLIYAPNTPESLKAGLSVALVGGVGYFSNICSNIYSIPAAEQQQRRLTWRAKSFPQERSLSMDLLLLSNLPSVESAFVSMQFSHGGAKPVAGGTELVMESIAPMIKRVRSGE
jgi:hypothetical protein